LCCLIQNYKGESRIVLFRVLCESRFLWMSLQPLLLSSLVFPLPEFVLSDRQLMRSNTARNNDWCRVQQRILGILYTFLEFPLDVVPSVVVAVSGIASRRRNQFFAQAHDLWDFFREGHGGSVANPRRNRCRTAGTPSSNKASRWTSAAPLL